MNCQQHDLQCEFLIEDWVLVSDDLGLSLAVFMWVW